MKAKSILMIVMTLAIAGIIIGYVFPIGLNAMHDTTENTLELEEKVESDVTNDMTIYVTNVNNTANWINATVNDTANGDTYTISELDVGNSTTFDTKLGEITFSLDSVDSATECTIIAEYGNDFGWSGASRNIYSILGIFLIITILIVIVSLVLKVM